MTMSGDCQAKIGLPARVDRLDYVLRKSCYAQILSNFLYWIKIIRHFQEVFIFENEKLQDIIKIFT